MVKPLSIKRMILASLVIMLANIIQAQNPVSWIYSAKKIDNKTWELHLTATIQPGWHLYSQTQPADAIAIPTEIKFNKNPVLSITGKPKEFGKLQKHKEKSLGIEQWQYPDKVEFVQTVKLRSDIKTNVCGSIEYQVCTDEKCLPPTSVKFNVSLGM